MIIRLFALVAILFGPIPQEREKGLKGHSLIDVQEATDVSGEIGEGGFDARVVGGRWLASKLRFCGRDIQTAGRAWATKYKLQVIREDVSGTRVMLQMTDGKLGGMFELLYHYTSAPEKASVKLNFIQFDGSTVTPELSFPNLRVDILGQSLKKAMECSGR